MTRRDQSRTALVDSAATLFRRQGYAATGVNQILEVAEVKPGSLYHHFPGGKQELAAAVVESAGAAIARQLRHALRSDLPVADVTDGWIDGLAAALGADERDGCPIAPAATESVHSSPAVRAASARAFQDWCDALAERLRADGRSAEDAESIATAVVSQIEGALLLSRVAGDVVALTAAKAAIRRLVS
ncbi:TetR/AcrR family transcriptional regulator [Nocardia sp. NPDC003482]